MKSLTIALPLLAFCLAGCPQESTPTKTTVEAGTGTISSTAERVRDAAPPPVDSGTPIVPDAATTTTTPAVDAGSTPDAAKPKSDAAAPATTTTVKPK